MSKIKTQKKKKKNKLKLLHLRLEELERRMEEVKTMHTAHTLLGQRLRGVENVLKELLPPEPMESLTLVTKGPAVKEIQ